jgi:ABC-type glycerol-3-phosphate transport system substrate-binding protein
MPALLAGLLLAGSINASAKVTLTYWEKWTGFEGDILKRMVDNFNKKQNKIFIKLTLGWDVQEKFLTACAAGNPPDIVGLWNHRLAPYVDAGLVEPLDQYFKLMNISKKDFVPAYWDMMNFKGKMYGAPITPSAFTFYWNKGEFAEAGLNPDVPPKTMEEIMLFNDKLTKQDGTGRLKQIGYTPSNPAWWPYLWPVFFGGDLFNEDKNSVDLLATPMVKGYDWIATMSKKLG